VKKDWRYWVSVNIRPQKHFVVPATSFCSQRSCAQQPPWLQQQNHPK